MNSTFIGRQITLDQSALDQLLGVISAPVRTLRTVSEERPVAVAVAVILLTSLTSFIVTPFSIFQELMPQMAATQARLSSWAFGLVATAILLVAIHVIAKAFSTSGTLPGFISAYGYSRFPGLFEFPLLVVGSTVLAPLANIASLALSLWLLVLGVLAIRESYELRTGASLLVLFLSFLATAFVLAIVSAVMVLGLGSSVLST